MLAWFANSIMAGYDRGCRTRDAEIATLNRHYSMLVAQNFDLTHQVESLKAAKEQTERERDTYRDASRVAGQGIAARDRKLSAIEKAVRMRTGDGLAHRILAIIGTEKS